MKTNQVLVRPMGQFQVEQRTKDGMFNATSLLKAWNSAVNLNTQNSGDLKKKDMDDFFANKNVKEFIDALVDEENLNGENSPYLSSRGKNGGTWMHPILFIKFAMWINPRFEVQVIKFVYDQLIKYRNEAGDAYRELGAAIQSIVPKDFMPKAMMKVGEALNWIVFNNHEKMIRNKNGDESSMQELFTLERKVADLINEGFIKGYDGLIAYLRKKYIEKNNPKVFML